MGISEQKAAADARSHRARITTCAEALIVGFLILSGETFVARGQADPGAIRAVQVSAFAGGSGLFTGIGKGRNLSVTAGADLRFRTYRGLDPAVEVRGTEPVAPGQVDSQQNILAGPKVGKSYQRVHPYADFLVGRGKISYFNRSYPGPKQRPLDHESSSYVFSPGAGVDIDFMERLTINADVQVQRYNIPDTGSGSIYSKSITLGFSYTFKFSMRER